MRCDAMFSLIADWAGCVPFLGGYYYNAERGSRAQLEHSAAGAKKVW